MIDKTFFHYDELGRLISVEGAELPSNDDRSDDTPRDNRVLFLDSLWDAHGKLLQSVSASGLVTAFSYRGSKLRSVYPGQAQYSSWPNWREHFTGDGYLLCAHESNGDDRSQLPAYVSTITPGVSVVADPMGIDAPLWNLINRDEKGASSAERWTGQWTSRGQSLDFRVELTGLKAFNLSLFSHCLDQLFEDTLWSEDLEGFGRDIELTVTDLRGKQSFRVTLSVSGVWVTFPVVGDNRHPVLVSAVCPESQYRPTLSALAFDAYKDRRVPLRGDLSRRDRDRVIEHALDQSEHSVAVNNYLLGLRSLRMDRRLSLARLATLLGVSQDAISCHENQLFFPPPEFVVAACKLLGCEVWELYHPDPIWLRRVVALLEAAKRDVA